MITVTSSEDVADRDRLALSDPFQLAPPVWQHYTMFLLPPEMVQITIEERNRMGIKVVAVTEAPNPMHGKVSSNQDYLEVMSFIKNPATDPTKTDPTKKAIALVVTMSDPSWSAKNDKGAAKFEKPGVVFAGLLRRHFTADGLALTAYASGKMEVTIKKGEPTKKRK